MLSVLHSQYHACWCTGDFRSQCINRHGIDHQSRIIPSPASEELIEEAPSQSMIPHDYLCDVLCDVATILWDLDKWINESNLIIFFRLLHWLRYERWQHYHRRINGLFNDNSEIISGTAALKVRVFQITIWIRNLFSGVWRLGCTGSGGGG